MSTEEKAKPPAEPYDFILEKLKSAFLAELELANYRPEDFDLSDVMKQIDELAKDVYEGRKEQVEAVKEAILKARELIQAVEEVKQKFADLVKEGDETVKTYDKLRAEIVRAEKFTEGEAKKKKSELDAITKKLKTIVKELKGLYETSRFKDIKDKIEEYEGVIEEIKDLKKEIDKEVVKLPEHVRKILDKLKTTFVAQLELAGFKKEDIEKEWEAIQPDIEELADKVAKGEISLAEAIKEVVRNAKVITLPTLPKEVKVEEASIEERPRKRLEERPLEVTRPSEVALSTKAPETIEFAMHVKDVLDTLGWKGVIELLKPYLPEIFAQGLWNFFEMHKEWSMAIPPVRKNLEPIFRNLRRAIEQKSFKDYKLGRLSFREWLLGGLPKTVDGMTIPEEDRIHMLSDLIYLGYTSKEFKDSLRKLYDKFFSNHKTRKIFENKFGRIPTFEEFYSAMIEFLKQYRL